MRLPRLAVAVALAMLLTGCAETAPTANPRQQARLSAQATSPTPSSSPTAKPKPLEGVVIALDPGHQLGNSAHPDQVNRLVVAGTGRFKKACNSTGTATNDGFPEATFTWDVVRLLKRRLVRLGATVKLTRTTNSVDDWGPCVSTRGRFGGKVDADLLLSVHGDGAPSSAHGFFGIAPLKTRMFHPKMQGESLRLVKALVNRLGAHGFARSNYIGGGSGYYRRDDLGTLNLSSVPVAMFELGNMRNSGDAATMASKAGRKKYALALAAGIRRFLGK